VPLPRARGNLTGNSTAVISQSWVPGGATASGYPAGTCTSAMTYDDTSRNPHLYSTRGRRPEHAGCPCLVFPAAITRHVPAGANSAKPRHARSHPDGLSWDLGTVLARQLFSIGCSPPEVSRRVGHRVWRLHWPGSRGRGGGRVPRAGARAGPSRFCLLTRPLRQRYLPVQPARRHVHEPAVLLYEHGCCGFPCPPVTVLGGDEVGLAGAGELSP
jgi:hypothetical protein